LAKVEAAKVEGASDVETGAQFEGEPEVEGSLVVLFSRSFCASPSPEDEGFTEPEFIAVDRAGEGVAVLSALWQSICHAVPFGSLHPTVPIG
jgi:hypothetical protein